MPAKQFLSVEDDGGENRLRLHEDVVRSLLMSDDVADKPVVVISVAGAYRTGKSFLLNAMSRYLMASDKSHWLDNKSSSFSWKSGCEGHTNGIFMSHPIKVPLQSGQEVVLLLMDTQGIFDSNSTTTDSTRIFALSTLLSSVQVYNVMNNLKNDDLENLQLFAEYGRKAMDNTEGKPFQDIVFLIRDWYHTQNYQVGRKGGNDLIKNRLSSSKESLAKGREHIKTCFTDVSGFLLPHPGAVVAGSPTFSGDAEDMDPAFRSALEELVSTLLSPEKLTVKMNGNRPMTCRQLVTLIQTYTELFRSGKLPDVKNFLQAVAEVSNITAVHAELLTYKRRMEGMLGQDAPMLDESRLFGEHEQTKTEAVESFKLRRTMADPTREENYYHNLLVKDIEDWFKAKHKNKLEQDTLKAKAANEKLVQKCIKSFQNSTERGLKNSLLCEPRDEATIKEEHEKAKQEALKDFNARKLTVGSYTAEESKLRFEQALGDCLRQALAVGSAKASEWRMRQDLTKESHLRQAQAEESRQALAEERRLRRQELDKESRLRQAQAEESRQALAEERRLRQELDKESRLRQAQAEESRQALAEERRLRQELDKESRLRQAQAEESRQALEEERHLSQELVKESHLRQAQAEESRQALEEERRLRQAQEEKFRLRQAQDEERHKALAEESRLAHEQALDKYRREAPEKVETVKAKAGNAENGTALAQLAVGMAGGATTTALAGASAPVVATVAGIMGIAYGITAAVMQFQDKTETVEKGGSRSPEDQKHD